jgi:capsular polysaccharide transport system permease protein
MRALITQLHVVHALVLRETRTRYGDHQLGYAWALLGPILWVGTFYAMSHYMGRLAPPGTTVVAFLVTGIVPYVLFRNVAAELMAAISGNRGLLYYPQVRPLDLVMSRALLECATQLVVFVILMTASVIIDGKVGPTNVLTMLLGLALAGALGVSLGLVLCGLATFSPTLERAWGLVSRPMMWFSAIFYPVDSVPTALRNILLYNPVVHAIELVRMGWFPGYQSRHIDPWYPAAWVLVLLFFGLSLERVTRRRLHLS